MNHNKINESGYNEASKFGPSDNNPPMYMFDKKYDLKGEEFIKPISSTYSIKNKVMKQERLLIEMSEEKQEELWNGVYFIGTSYEIDGETYTSVDEINTSKYSDGESWDYIVQRKSDGLYFKFHVWDAGEHNGYLFQDEGLKQVFQTTKDTYE